MFYQEKKGAKYEINIRISTIIEAVQRFQSHVLRKISHYELSWYADDLTYIKALDEIKEKLSEIRLSVSDSPRKYIDNTLEVIEKEYT